LRRLIFCFIFVIGCNLFSQNRKSSAPYLSGDTFRSYADFIIDETEAPFSPENVTSGSTVFLKTDYLEYFFKEIHPCIASPYILITHNSDFPIPNGFVHMLDDEKLIAWFGQNVEGYLHPKLHPIPIGIANRHWPHGNTDIFDAVRMNDVIYSRDILLYMNFIIDTYYQERSRVYSQFIYESFCLYSPVKDMQSYLADLKMTKFVLCPRGNGLDCHRTWESLYMGAFPVVRTSTLDSLYEGLPVIIINDWNEVTQAFLEHKYEEMQQREFAWEKLYADYWFQHIDSFKKGFK